MDRIQELEIELKQLKRVARCKRKPGAGLGGAIQRRRHYLYLSLREVARRADVSTGILSKIERDPAPNVTLHVFGRIATALILKPSELLINAENNC